MDCKQNGYGPEADYLRNLDDWHERQGTGLWLNFFFFISFFYYLVLKKEGCFFFNEHGTYKIACQPEATEA